ncbi:putative VP5 [Microviridae sp.]|nr:putative VP5 [Microviridae sp.]
MFKKRKKTFDLGGFNPPRVPYCRTSDDGVRTNVMLSPDEYRQVNPVDFTDFSLTEEMAAGVDIRQLPTSSILDASPNMSDEQILETLEAHKTSNE